MSEENGGTPENSGTPEATSAPSAAPAATPAPAQTPAPAPTGEPIPTTPPAATGEPTPTEPPKSGEVDWAALRSQLAKGDEKLEKRLSRYSSLESMAEALIAAQDKIAKGEHTKPLSKDATPEELSAWRAANGVPETPEQYELKLPDGMVIGEADKPAIDEFLKTAHSLNMKPEDASRLVAWDMERQEALASVRAQEDHRIAAESTAELRKTWGTEFELNSNMITNLLSSAPEGVAEHVMNARAPDGTPLMSHIPTLRWLADTARTLNPTATIVPPSGSNTLEAMETEIAKYFTMAGDRNSEYWKGPMKDKHQARYRELLDMQEKYGKK